VEAAYVEGVNDVYSGNVTAAIDGNMISLPADSDRIIESNLLQAFGLLTKSSDVDGIG
jgi:hypothetical protein